MMIFTTEQTTAIFSYNRATGKCAIIATGEGEGIAWGRALSVLCNSSGRVETTDRLKRQGWFAAKLPSVQFTGHPTPELETYIKSVATPARRSAPAPTTETLNLGEK